ncbi:MAG: MFS transporter [Vulcanimicrobiota bacterium]
MEKPKTISLQVEPLSGGDPVAAPLIPSSRRYLVEFLLFTTYLVFGISWLAYAPLLPELSAEYGFDKAKGGLLISLVSLAKAFVPLFAGAMAARFGLHRALLVGAAFSGLAVALPFLPDITALMAGRFLFGVGGAIIVTLMGPLVMTWFPKKELPMVTGLNNVAVNTGITVALFATLPAAQHVGWKNTLVLFGALCAMLAVLWGVFGAEGPIKREVKTNTVEQKPSIMEMLKRSETYWLGLAFTGPLSLYLALNSWLPSHYETAFGLERAAASQLTGLFNLVGIPVAILGGYLCSKFGKRRPLIILAGILMPLSSYLLVNSPVAEIRLTSAVVLGASLFLYVAPLFTIPMELPNIDAPRVALMMGCVFSLAYIVSTISPWLTGYLYDAYGSYAYGLSLFCVMSGLLAIGGFMLPETGQAAE